MVLRHLTPRLGVRREEPDLGQLVVDREHERGAGLVPERRRSQARGLAQRGVRTDSGAHHGGGLRPAAAEAERAAADDERSGERRHPLHSGDPNRPVAALSTGGRPCASEAPPHRPMGLS